MSTGRRRHVAVLFAAFCFLFSIAQGKDAPSSEVATITGSVVGDHKFLKGLDERVVITSVDHVPVAMQLLFPTANTVQTLKPGRHFIHARYTQRGWGSNGRLWVDAEAGKAYSVHARMHSVQERYQKYEVEFWIEDKASGAIVGGIDTGDEGKDASAPTAPVPVSAPVSAPAATPVPVAAEGKPAAPDYALATIRGFVSKEKTFLGGPVQRIHVTCIDDLEVSDPLSVSFESKKHTLLAGKHHICVQALTNTSKSTGKFWIDAEPGKNYVIHPRSTGYRMQFWVEDADTHETVATKQ